MGRHQPVAAATALAGLLAAASTALPWKEATFGVVHLSTPGYEHPDGQVALVLALAAAVVALIGATQPTPAAGIVTGALAATAGLALCAIVAVDFDDVADYIGLGFLALGALALVLTGLGLATMFAALAARTPPTPSAAAALARWAPDPTQRAQFRWWDGTRWTEHVLTDGQRGTDPM